MSETMPLPIPISIGGGGPPSSSSQQQRSPPGADTTSTEGRLRALLDARKEANAVLRSRELAKELESGIGGAESARARQGLEKCLQLAEAWTSTTPATTAAAAPSRGGLSGIGSSLGHQSRRPEAARVLFVKAWALGRLGEFDGTAPAELPDKLRLSLEVYRAAGSAAGLPSPPALEDVPSVARPSGLEGGRGRAQQQSLQLETQPAWVGDMLAEHARLEATLALAYLLQDGVNSARSRRSASSFDEKELMRLIESACRRNAQALFTPLTATSPTYGQNSLDGREDEEHEADAGTVVGTASLLDELCTMASWSGPLTSSDRFWTSRIHWASHVTDVRFVSATVQASRIVEEASTRTKILQAGGLGTSPLDARKSFFDANEVRETLHETIRAMVPFEMRQGKSLVKLGRVMLEAVWVLHAGQEYGCVARRRQSVVEPPRASRPSRGGAADEGPAAADAEAELEEETLTIPENDLVRETRLVFSAAAAHFENAYEGFRKSPPRAGTEASRTEQTILRWLEEAYCHLDELDTGAEALAELREARAGRAVQINERLVDLSVELDGEDEDESDDDESGHAGVSDDREELARRLHLAL